LTWTKLLASKQAQKHKTSKKELDNMRALIARDLADAALAGLSADRRFATAYNAALQAANMACLLRRGGVPASMVMGAQILPFKAHAWTEADGRAINERREVQKIYTPWERC
jgi:Transglutaminase-like superfamily